MAITQVPPYTGDTPMPGQQQPTFNQNVADQLNYMNQLAPAINTTIGEIDVIANQVDVAANQIDVVANQVEVNAIIAASAANYDTEFVAGVTSAVKGKSYLYDGSMWACLNDTTETPAIGNVNWYSLANHNSLTNRDISGAHPASAISQTNGGSVQDFIDDYEGFTDALLDESGIVQNGQPDKLGESQRLDAMRVIFLSDDLVRFGWTPSTVDATSVLNAALATVDGELDLKGRNLVCEGDIVVPPSSGLRKLSLNGGKLTIKSGVFNIQVDHSFTIDLGGGDIDLGLKKAQLASNAHNGNVFNVIDSSEFSIGDVVTCSFDLNGLPNDTARSTLPGSVLNTIANIVGNQITMTYPFTANGGGGAQGYTSIPAGAWIINSIFTKAGIYYTGSGTLNIKNGKCGKSSSGTVVTVNNTDATFLSQNVDYDEAGLDMFNLRCKNIVFDGFFIGSSYDIAKQGVVPEWSGLLSMSKGKFKRNNFDGEFYLPYGSQLGDMYLSEVEGDGTYDGGVSTGAFSGNSLFVGKFVHPNLKLRSLKLDRCRFNNYQRNGFGSGDDVVTTATINSIEINNSECNVPWLRTTFADPVNNFVSSNHVKIYGGSMGCSLSYRSNAGFTNVVYDNVDLIAPGVVRYLNCQIDNCRFNGGSHAIDSQTVLLGVNSLANSGKVLMQTGKISASAKLKVPSFRADLASGTYFPITNYVDSSLGQYYPNIELVVPDFVPKVIFGNANASIKYTIEMSRVSENTAPFDAKSRHAVYLPAGSKVIGVTDVTLYKSTVASTSVMSTDYASGTVDLVQNNSGTLPAIGDIFAVLYANAIVGYHRITAAAGNSFTISPALREDITISTLCGLNKVTKIY